ncbi:MAG: flagellar hook-associated protein 3 FlgL [Pseudomonadota bacterium]
MRVGTAQSYGAGVEQLTQRQSELSEAAIRLNSGKRVAKASDDPAAAARAERALSSIVHITTDLRAVEASRTVTAITESALGDAGELLQKVRETLVGAGNASYTNSERKIQAQDLSALRDQLLAVANRRDSADGYLFAGPGLTTAPFQADASGVVSFVGPAGDTRTEASTDLPLSTNGQSVWMQPAGSTSDIFSALSKAIADLGTPGLSSAEISARNTVNIANVDAGMSSLQSARSTAGEVLSRIDSQSGLLDDRKLANQTERSNAEDLDMMAAYSDFQAKQTGYDAALKSYSMVQRMSLFQYLT